MKKKTVKVAGSRVFITLAQLDQHNICHGERMRFERRWGERVEISTAAVRALDDEDLQSIAWGWLVDNLLREDAQWECERASQRRRERFDPAALPMCDRHSLQMERFWKTQERLELLEEKARARDFARLYVAQERARPLLERAVEAAGEKVEEDQGDPARVVSRVLVELRALGVEVPAIKGEVKFK